MSLTAIPGRAIVGRILLGRGAEDEGGIIGGFPPSATATNVSSQANALIARAVGQAIGPVARALADNRAPTGVAEDPTPGA